MGFKKALILSVLPAIYMTWGNIKHRDFLKIMHRLMSQAIPSTLEWHKSRKRTMEGRKEEKENAMLCAVWPPATAPQSLLTRAVTPAPGQPSASSLVCLGRSASWQICFSTKAEGKSAKGKTLIFFCAFFIQRGNDSNSKQPKMHLKELPFMSGIGLPSKVAMDDVVWKKCSWF